MSKQMLIDAVHPEETRVAVVTDGTVDDFDFETTGKEQLRGNIYLAKITRVEPSLQAAFVDYGGNRHGFLAFSEIHPDYYQLPQADREALLAEAAAAAAEADEFDDEDDEDENGQVEAEADADADADANGEAESDGEEADEARAEAGAGDGAEGEDQTGGDEAETGKPAAKAETSGRGNGRKRRPPRNSKLKQYKIQEVIRRRQVLLVQVLKEERGNKGAALTTYLSLAGRYSVLMPNTPRGGGISRKITNTSDRRRLKKIMTELEVPEGMGLIVRTAGAKRTKTEIKRDFDYLLKLWDKIRETTLESMAPCLIHEEANLVHRAMRDMFDKDIEDVFIQGEEAYREAKDLAKLLMPSQAKKVQQWKEATPVFVAEGVEEELDSIYSPQVRLPSGGYLVINQTEALVAIDVNSGKSTKARNIEQTALQTNLEAADEACRQMRLRDLAGLVVIDFIDMEENKNNRAVEKKMKDCLKLDRARVQMGRISQFGLMEISRQRRRAGLLQATSDVCEACNGTGRRRSVSSAALQLIRAIEMRAAGGGLLVLKVNAPTEVALYILNEKREAITRLEQMAGCSITITSSADTIPGDFTIEVEKDPDAKPAAKRKRGRKRPDTSADLEVIDTEAEAAEETDGEADAEVEAEPAEEQPKKRRRRGRRGGRRRKRRESEGAEGAAATAEAVEGADAGKAEAVEAPAEPAEPQPVAAEAAPRPARQRKPAPPPEDGGAYLDGLSVSPAEMLDAGEAAPAESQAVAPEMDAKPEPVAEPEPESAPEAVPEVAEPAEAKEKPRKRGWWSRGR